ncbi:polysaccharide lyase family 7 protein [Candidatus Roizmanbacteria bacterium]|nr:polysaccharide lyase family 7 protein [Candidatus Roizmanbacteria bacterium]
MDIQREIRQEFVMFSLIFFTLTVAFFLMLVHYSKEDKTPVFAQFTEGSLTPSPTLTPPTPTPTESGRAETPTSLPTLTLTVMLTNTPAPTAVLTNTPIPIPTESGPTPTTSVSTLGGTYPSQILNLSDWKLTLPTGKSKSPTEITQPELAKYNNDPWFLVAQGGVRFRAAVNGVTTSGSGYPRSELREMTNEGKEKASWSSTSGIHTMAIEQAITAVPQKKQHVVAGQIHDSDDDVIVIRLEYPKLYVNVDGKNKYTLDANYTLGKRFTVKFEVKDGQTKIYYNNASEPSYVLSKNYSKAYFKAGDYTQSNCSKEGSGLCNDSNFGEVVIYQLSVTHQ